MGRRSDHTIQELTQMIVDAAYAMVEQEGIEKLSTRKIATKIGYTVGTLYNIFQNLDDIIVHINGRTLDALISQLENSAKIKNNKAPIKNLAAAYFDFSKTHSHLWLLLFEHVFPPEHPFPRWYKTKIERIIQVVCDTLAMSVPNLSDERSKECVSVLWAGIHGICALALRDKLIRTGHSDARALLDNFIDNYLSGVKNHSV